MGPPRYSSNAAVNSSQSSNITSETVEQTNAEYPDFDVTKLQLDDLLPPHEVLNKLYLEKYVSLPARVQRQICQAVLDSLIENKQPFEIRCPAQIKLAQEVLLKGQLAGFRLLRIASLNHDKDAEFRCAQMLAAGFPGCKRDLPRALEMLERLAEQNHGTSQYVLGLRALTGKSDMECTDYVQVGEQSQQEGESSNIQKGLEWMHMAADNGSVHAYAQLGHLYAKGMYVPKDAAKAHEYLEKAKEKGHVEATFVLAGLYGSGEGLEGNKPDPDRALECYLFAAEKGLAIAQHNVGCIYFQGPASGVQKLKQPEVWRAVEYWKMAAAQGLQLSQVNLGKLYLEGFPAGDAAASTNLVAPENRIPRDLDLAQMYLQAAVGRTGLNENNPITQDALFLLTQVREAKKQGGGQKQDSRCVVM
ncbi:hypothetical protein HK102_003598 [Quaeritorhiza haematococci]|nr:hypothetical protein HK102_003598 [Quaeritorhiza haematococci]